ncbi:YciI family protein [Cohnella sp. JJ-181]|uniref:YciI family protein n=1 Tax=Cohnella rhizoplanae TaxID=2974897 RepID=UPI0022FF8DA2|nr:YciI family protein [Cohnella sp. JJ-181]CAI6083801.1 hypothetical protein COHCIP112018_04130 [Cohnella sp. JJ-181]
MRYMILIKASARFEAGIGPEREQAAAFADYSRRMKEAGVLVEAATLLPSAGGMRMSFPRAGGPPAMISGPSGGADDPVVAGYMLLEAASEQEAYAWAARMPDPYGFGEGGIELRRLRETDAAEETADLRPLESELRHQLAALKKR